MKDIDCLLLFGSLLFASIITRLLTRLLLVYVVFVLDVGMQNNSINTNSSFPAAVGKEEERTTASPFLRLRLHFLFCFLKIKLSNFPPASQW